jgi:hypothetical protein
MAITGQPWTISAARLATHTPPGRRLIVVPTLSRRINGSDAICVKNDKPSSVP